MTTDSEKQAIHAPTINNMCRQFTTTLRQHRTIFLSRSIRSACVFGSSTASCISSNCRSRFSSITRSDSHLTLRLAALACISSACQKRCAKLAFLEPYLSNLRFSSFLRHQKRGILSDAPFLVHRTNLNPNRYPNRSPAKRVRFGKGRRNLRICSFPGSYGNQGSGME